MEPKSPSKLKLPVNGLNQYERVVRIGVVISVAVLILFCVLFFVFRSNEDQRGRPFRGSYYTVVVDCGSTGTRVSVFEWVLKEGNKRELPILLNSYPDNSTKSSVSKNSCKYHCLQTEPGLHKLVGNSSSVRDSLEPLLTWAEQIVPIERQKATPIFVLATAGLRTLEIEDANRVLGNVESVLKEHSFLYQRSWIRVLSGKEEAYYGWVALNYKMGIFRNHPGLPTLGLLDLGGSSLQVVMEVDNVEGDTHLVRSKFGFIEHRILAFSLPAFGLNGAFDRTVVLLSRTEAARESSDGTLELRHPCLDSDFVQNYTCSGCSGLNVSESKNIDRAKGSKFLNLKLVGVPNWERCKMLAVAAATNSSSLVDYNARLCFDGGSGVLNSTALPHQIPPQFHALSGFFAVHEKLNLSPQAELTKILEKGQALCTQSWAKASSVSNAQRHAAPDCFRIPYMASLVEDALCLGDREIVFGPADVSWTLGAALIEGEYLWLDTANSQISTLTAHLKFMPSPVFVFFLLVCLLVVVYQCQVKLPMVGKKKASGSGVSSHLYSFPRRRPN